MASTFWTGVGISDAFDTNAGMPGAAPLGTQMQGNPSPSQEVVPSVNVEPPAPQNTPAQLAHTQLSNGNIPHNLQPTNVAQAGGDSVLAMIARGQVSLNQSNYGQGGYLPSGGGAPPLPSASPAVAQVTGNANGVTYAGVGNYSGM